MHRGLTLQNMGPPAAAACSLPGPGARGGRSLPLRVCFVGCLIECGARSRARCPPRRRLFGWVLPVRLLGHKGACDRCQAAAGCTNGAGPDRTGRRAPAQQPPLPLAHPAARSPPPSALSDRAKSSAASTDTQPRQTGRQRRHTSSAAGRPSHRQIYPCVGCPAHRGPIAAPPCPWRAAAAGGRSATVRHSCSAAARARG